MEGTEENIISQDVLSQSMTSTQPEMSTQDLLLAVSTSMPASQPNGQPENQPARQPAPPGRDPPKSRESRESIDDRREGRQERWLTNQQSVRRNALTAKRATPMQNNFGELTTNTEEQPSQDVLEEQPHFNTGTHAQQQAPLPRKAKPSSTPAPASAAAPAVAPATTGLWDPRWAPTAIDQLPLGTAPNFTRTPNTAGHILPPPMPLFPLNTPTHPINTNTTLPSLPPP
jgi:hypothetical protein